jgi:hypothetical protein
MTMDSNDRNLGRASRRIFVSAAWTVLGLAFASTAFAQSDHNSMRNHSSLSVEFTDCVESIGVGLIATAQARALVPSEFQLAGDGTPVTPIVVRTARCGGIAVNGHRPRAGKIVQIGAVIVPPDFTGDINNYTLWYYTSNGDLARHLVRIGVRAQHVPTLDYDYHRSEAGGQSSLHVAVTRPGEPTLRLDGLVVASDTSAGSFEANWWVKAGRHSVKMATNVPEIFIGGADLLLKTRRQNQLGQLIGGDTLGFPVLQQFNVFANANMQVSLAAP